MPLASRILNTALFACRTFARVISGATPVLSAYVEASFKRLEMEAVEGAAAEESYCGSCTETQQGCRSSGDAAQKAQSFPRIHARRKY
jgi:hypothetical protein